MGIKANFDIKGIQTYIDGKKKLLHDIVVRDLNYLGMECIIVARSLNTYIDRTSNLRNSIGYVVARNGVILNSTFPNDAKGTERDKGKQVGEDFAESLVKDFPFGYSLIVVAGMEYASYVEDVRHYEVLEPAKAHAKIKQSQIADKIVKSFKRIAR